MKKTYIIPSANVVNPSLSTLMLADSGSNKGVDTFEGKDRGQFTEEDLSNDDFWN